MVSGTIVAGPHVRNSCQRHLDDLQNGRERGLTYDLAAAQRVWGYFENVLRLSEGQFEGRPFDLHPSQAFKLGSIFGWKREDGSRRFRRAYIEEGKGNGKSPLAGGIGLYGLTSDAEPGAQIYAAAAKKDQAAILFQDAVKMTRKSPALSKRLVVSGGEGREFNLANVPAGSFFRPISKEAGKTGSGPRPHFALCDEVHEHPDRSIMEMLERGFKFRQQPLLLMITNSGSDRNSICWEEHEHAIRVAAGTREIDANATYVGEPIDDTTFSFVCSLDKGDDPLTNPACWAKANPLLGVTITEEYLAGVVAQARDLPGKLNGILRLHFCVWTDAEEAWLSRPTLESVLSDFDPVVEHVGKEIFFGLDLSATQDLTALGCVVPTGFDDKGRPTFDAWVEAWTPADTMRERAVRDKAPYDVWHLNGWLQTTPGKVIGFDFVAARLLDLCSIYAAQALAYDTYGFNRHFKPQMDELGISVAVVEHPQGGKRKGAEGLWMPGSKLDLETLILERRIRLRRSPVLISAIMSAATDHDPWGNTWFAKQKATNRIDPLVSLAMAVGAAMSGTKSQNRFEDALASIMMV